VTGFPLHLLRHGAPETPGLLLGRTDMRSSAAGVAACAAKARGVAAERIVTSDLLRCRQAAAIIGDAKGIVPIVDPRWRELDFGAWDGRAGSQIDNDALARFWNDPDGCPPPGGERWSSLVARVDAALVALDPLPTLIVTHGGTIRAALHSLCGFDPRQTWSFDLPYGVLVSLRVWRGDVTSAQIVEIAP